MQLVIKDTATIALDALGARLRDRAPIAEAAGLAVVQLAIRSFNDPAVRAAPWAPLQERTLARKVAEGTSTAILKRRGVLFRSWRVIEATNDHVIVGSDRFYAMFHQFGTARGLPARPMLPITGGPGSSALTPLAVRNLTAAAKAKLQEMLGT